MPFYISKLYLLYYPLKDGISLIVANLSVIMSFLFSSKSASSEEHNRTAWPSSRRTPARSFGFLSTVNPDQTTPLTHIQLRVRAERDYQTKTESLKQSESVEVVDPFGRRGDDKDNVSFRDTMELGELSES